MSLLAIRPPEMERASMVLPTITCSSCSAPIPLSSLGEHVCLPIPLPSRPPTNSTQSINPKTGPRNVPRPTQITIPNTEPSRRNGPNTFTVNPPRPPFAGPSSARSSPSTLGIPSVHNSPHIPSPTGQNVFPPYTPNSRTPSPTNPFFPPNTPMSGNGIMIHGLGLSVGRAEGPYPTDAHIPDRMKNSIGMPDTTSGGGAGMAGVGRRAFAAAAWGVRAGVAMSNTTTNKNLENSREMPPPNQGWPTQPRSAGPSHQQSKQMFSPTPMSAPLPPSQPRLDISSRLEAVTQESVSNTNTSRPNLPNRQHTTSSRSSHKGDSISELIKARSNRIEERKDSNGGAFFNKVRQLSTSSSSAMSDRPSALGVLRRPSQNDSQSSQRLVASPEETILPLPHEDDYDDESTASALPWATPAVRNRDRKSPDIGREDRTRLMKDMRDRYPTAESESSSSIASSSRSGKWGGGSGSGPESEELVTPSQSWEGGLSERVLVQKASKNGFGGFGIEPSHDSRDTLEQIGEEEEEEVVVFGGKSPKSKSTSRDSQSRNENKNQIISISRPGLSINGKDHIRSHTAPEPRSDRSLKTNVDRQGERERTRRKICQKCHEEVGGDKRFVERDGVVLCEKDWKKLYLPSCRRCNLPIEKSAVSSSDGQLKGKWHRSCFTCTKCDKPFEGDSFYVLGGKPWCQQHYHEENGTLCSNPTCRKPIEGPCILTSGPKPNRYHPGHLRCDHRGGVSGVQSCKENMDEYYEVDGGRYCERHVSEAMRNLSVGMGMGMGMKRAEKRRTRLVELPGAF
ncbi:hypothetical protein TREMEDRAFT_70205 [Tremella mesenterica DSM 1558]|uniref:uncharacterized protein n=1 Tax=Tremella mesenterica (strain ATCC 24925 / CBS 8224 / DSM 1558 / NBRC 9311 / NRRL Y-6157 / RJB 2259-6 / UBC 559-6) TaxID=578456 RepID=UPI00032C9168|nr:uncharacterized protein TREMEDRAFT_70205 [Tremella mesenterica DSM 1558]EIW66279.1 hypothetical protein TREMEDRAFT_70205 [Tremella mesenterica DSM 1558]